MAIIGVRGCGRKKRCSVTGGRLFHGADVLADFHQSLAQRLEARDDLGGLYLAALVARQQLARGGNLEAAHLDQVVDDAHFLNVLLGVAADIAGRLLRRYLRKLLLPIAQGGLVDVEHGGYLADGVELFEISWHGVRGMRDEGEV